MSWKTIESAEEGKRLLGPFRVKSGDLEQRVATWEEARGLQVIWATERLSATIEVRVFEPGTGRYSTIEEAVADGWLIQLSPGAPWWWPQGPLLYTLLAKKNEFHVELAGHAPGDLTDEALKLRGVPRDDLWLTRGWWRQQGMEGEQAAQRGPEDEPEWSVRRRRVEQTARALLAVLDDERAQDEGGWVQVYPTLVQAQLRDKGGLVDVAMTESFSAIDRLGVKVERTEKPDGRGGVSIVFRARRLDGSEP